MNEGFYFVKRKDYDRGLGSYPTGTIGGIVEIKQENSINEVYVIQWLAYLPDSTRITENYKWLPYENLSVVWDFIPVTGLSKDLYGKKE